MKLTLSCIALCLFQIMAIGQHKNHFVLQSEHSIDLLKAERITELPSYQSSDIRTLIPALKQWYANQNTEIDFVLWERRSSPAGEHLLYKLIWQNRRVYRAEVKVNLAKNGKILSVYRLNLPLMENRNTELVLANPSLLIPQGLQPSIEEAVWFPFEDGLREATLVEYHTKDASFHKEVVFDALGNIMYWQDLNRYFSAPMASVVDTPVQLMVFNPDPLTTAGVTYGGVYSDQNDNDVTALNNQRVQRSARATFSAGTYKLENDHVVIVDFESPSIAPVTQNNPNFFYTRSQSGFENANVFYHLTFFQDYMQSLGFQLVDYPLEVDTHGWDGQDQSSFSPGVGLSFGEGGVDDAEDADVVIHEYGHAISNDAAPNSMNGVERRTLDEAWGDYLAVSYSQAINPFGWFRVFSWDGHNEYWNGRSAQTTKNYQNINFGFNIYEHTDLWSGVLMEILAVVGRGVTDACMLQTLYSQANNMTFEQAALDFLAADSLFHGGVNSIAMYNAFKARGILNIPNFTTEEAMPLSDGIRIKNSSGFAQGEYLTIESSEEFETVVFSMNGLVVFKGESVNKTMNLNGEDFKKGLYVVQIKQGGETKTLKLVRY